MVKYIFGTINQIRKSGLYDWIILRISAIAVLLYVMYILCFFYIHNVITYDMWIKFFYASITRLFTTIVLFLVISHVWIGLWQIITDYIKCTYIYKILRSLIISVLCLYFCYGLTIVFRI